MNPTEHKVEVTRFECGQCHRMHPHRDLADSCCACEVCGKRPATMKLHSFTQYMTHCAGCHRSKLRRTLRDQITRHSEEATRLKAKLAEIESAIAKARTQLDLIGTRRDAEQKEGIS